ncbi:UNVERIFIED_CONTAM: hypothetical protein H355_016418 [Colinus virginianus]|nr:hypothetical protein H355_016418 [Colinus virginianus]
MDSFGIFLQGLLGVVAFSTLMPWDFLMCTYLAAMRHALSSPPVAYAVFHGPTTASPKYPCDAGKHHLERLVSKALVGSIEPPVVWKGSALWAVEGSGPILHGKISIAWYLWCAADMYQMSEQHAVGAAASVREPLAWSSRSCSGLLHQLLPSGEKVVVSPRKS